MLTYAHVFSRMLTVLRMQARDASLEETAEAAAGAAKERAELLQSLEVPYIEYASIRPHTSAYVSIRCERASRAATEFGGPLYIIRQHTSAYVSIRAEFGGAPIELVLPKDVRPHTSAYVRIRQQSLEVPL